MSSFPLNAWYACAYDVEVKKELLARTVCNQKVVMFRRLDERVAILEDACWHRLLPLSKGRLDGAQLLGRDLAFRALLAGIEQVFRTQEAADVVGAKRWAGAGGHASLQRVGWR